MTGAFDAAVLVALFDRAGEAHVLLTRRTTTLSRHGGEVAFPGGRVEGGEAPVETALREAREEVGLAPADVSVVGALSTLRTFALATAITPVVGTIAAPPHESPSPAEVARIFDVALSDLLDPSNYARQWWRRGPDLPWFAVHFFRVPGEVVWGATARILTELLAVVTGTTDELRAAEEPESRPVD